MRRGLLAVMVAVALAGAAAAGLWYAAASGALTVPVARWISGQIGRALAADGGLRIRVGRVTRISVEGLRLANASWGTRPEMLVAQRLDVEIDTRSLLEQTLVLRQVTAAGLDLWLERTARGESNWALQLPARDQPRSAALPVVIERMSLPGARVRFSGPRLERPLDIELDRAEQSSLADGLLRLEARGQANDLPLDLRLDLGPLASLVAGRDIAVAVDGHVGEVALAATGRIDDLDRPADTALKLAVSGPDAAYLAARLGIRNLGSGPFSLEGALEPAPGDAGLRGWLAGRLGGFEVGARAFVREPAVPGMIAVQARVAGPDLSLAGGITGINGLPAEPFRLQLDLQRTGDAIRIGQADLDLAYGRVRFQGALGGGAPDGGRIDFSASGEDLARLTARLGWPELAGGPFTAQGVLRRPAPDQLAVTAEATTPLGRLSATGPVAVVPGFTGTRLQVQAEGPDFAPIGKLLKLRDPPAGAFAAQGGVAWTEKGIALDAARLTVAGESLEATGQLGQPPWAAGTDLRLRLSGARADRFARRLGIGGLPAGAFVIQGRLQRQAKRSVLRDVEARLAGATLRLDGTVGDPPGWPGTDLAFDAGGPALERFATLVPGYALPDGAFRASGRFTRSGKLVGLRQLDLQAAGARGRGFVELDLPMDRSGQRFDLQASGPDLARLLPVPDGVSGAGKDFRLIATGSRLGARWTFQRLRLTTAEGAFSLQGDLALAPRFSTQALAVEMRTGNLGDLGRLVGRQWPAQPLELQARFAGNGDDFDLEELAGRLGGSDFTGRMQVRSQGGARDLDLRLESAVLDLRPYWQNPLRQSGPARKRRGDRQLLIPATAISLPLPAGYGGRMDVVAQQLYLGEERFRDLRVRGALSPRGLRLDPLAFEGPSGAISARIELESQPGGGLAVQVAGTGTNLALAPVPTGPRGEFASRFEAAFDLRGRGRDLRELAATLDGRLSLVGRGGRIANSRLMAAGDDFLSQLLRSLNPMTTRQPTTDVVCVAYLLGAKDGVLSTSPALVMQTTELNIISHGTVDLGTEKIDFSFKSAARKGLGLGIAQLVNPYIKVGGTLAAPGLALDPRGAVVNGGAAFATAGLSILATTAWDRVFSARDPCAAAVAEARRPR